MSNNITRIRQERRWVLPIINDHAMLAALCRSLTLDYKDLYLWKVHCQRLGVHCETFLDLLSIARDNMEKYEKMGCKLQYTADGAPYYDVEITDTGCRPVGAIEEGLF